MENNTGKILVKDSRRLFSRKLKNRFDGDLNREIAELIINSLDSYNRLVKSGLLAETAEQFVAVKLDKPIRKEKENKTICVIDQAEGMSRDELIKIFGNRGDDNNAGEDNVKIRGLFGLGASDCMNASAIEGKSAQYISFKDGKATKLRFSQNDEQNGMCIEPICIKLKDIKGLKKKYSIKNNGTVAIFGVPDSVNLPKDIDDFKKSLESSTLLRNLLMKENVNVTLEAYGASVRLSSKKYELKNPFLKKNISFLYKRRTFNGTITFYKNENKENNPTDILFQDDRGNVYDNQMFGFAKAQGGDKLSAVITIDKFWDILNDFLKQNIDLIKDDRTGIDTSKSFGKALVQSITKPINEALTVINREENVRNISLAKTKEYEAFLNLLNKDLNMNVSQIKSNIKFPPTDAIAFARKSISLTANHKYDLKVFINAEKVSAGDIIEIQSIGNDDNIEYTSEIKLVDSDFVSDNELISKSCMISGKKATDIPVELKASIDDYKTNCDVTIIDEDIIYPENGIQFEKNEAVFTPDVKHKKLRLYFDKDVVLVSDKINITDNSNGKLVCENSCFDINDGIMVTDTIGYMEIGYSGGDLKDEYTVIASVKGLSTKLKIKVEASKYNQLGVNGDIRGYKLDTSKQNIKSPSYYDPLKRMIFICQGNCINDSMITEYKENVSGKALYHVIALVCFEAAKLYVKKKVENGHLGDSYEVFMSEVEVKQSEYFSKFKSLVDKK